MQNVSFSKISAMAGILGCLVILACAWAAHLDYDGLDCEPYSMDNHFISELGDRRIAENSHIFNAGMMVSSVFLTLFGLGFAMIQRGWQRVIIAILGLVTGISCGFVGYYPEDILRPHLIAALIFFHSALALVFFCTGQTLFSRHRMLPKWTVIPGAVTAMVFAAFVLWPKDIVRAWMRDPVHFVRPAFWWHPILEWGCFFSIIVWILIVAVWVLRRQPVPR